MGREQQGRLRLAGARAGRRARTGKPKSLPLTACTRKSGGLLLPSSLSLPTYGAGSPSTKAIPNGCRSPFASSSNPEPSRLIAKTRLLRPAPMAPLSAASPEPMYRRPSGPTAIVSMYGSTVRGRVKITFGGASPPSAHG